ncbi:diaminopimelate decarboxylase [Candidatus Pandoraea novymonadis]|uniref:Diaminopimelate decarboxylase n=1 Tax=Candidatus Pandoraea novymonadis TaxID=1808959 RepID=A0ABX5FCJ9_9BURK|nr:diaminopimelate decarboxylase [Candidatus Pandoraea novymonadis]PSB91553.1 Diaminopimelate decarboxylase [Candidatus Pandoraea novymonadis]
MTNAFFTYRDDVLHAEAFSLSELAERFGTPLYIYSKAALTQAYDAYSNACKGKNATIHYAVKANSNLAVLSLFAELGAGFDIVSAGELSRVIAAGGNPNRVVFSGVGKHDDEMRYALEKDVFCFNVESRSELTRLNAVAREVGKRARLSIRVNPNVDAKTHPYISTGLRGNKFGVAYEEALSTYREALQLSHLQIVGIDCHIGSQITEVSPYLNAIDKVMDLVHQLEAENISLHHIDVGGGLGITYSDDETPPDGSTFASQLLSHLAERGLGHRQVLFEPGRSLVGNAGILLTKVSFLKPTETKNFAIVDAAMNDLTRPAMYGAYHNIVPVIRRENDNETLYDVVGPVCESGDWLGRDRLLNIETNDLLAIHSVGAYGFSMSSNYNTRPRAAEIIVDGSEAHLVRERETIESLFANEHLLPK